MSKRAEEVALERCPISSDAIKESRNQKKRAIFCNGYEQAEKDLAQDFHADTLIGDKDYAVYHLEVAELDGDLYRFCLRQGFTDKVKVIIVEDD